jgi:hypothetical protein
MPGYCEDCCVPAGFLAVRLTFESVGMACYALTP